MVKRGRVDRGRTVGLSAAREGKFILPGGDGAAEAVERPNSTAGGVYF